MRTSAELISFFEKNLTDFIAAAYADESTSLHKAVHYCLTGGGKRVRAQFCLLGAEAFGGNMRDGIRPAIALEMVHAYSLAHDDLPSMDNDDFRRGRPSLHRAFDEATALLVGDALLTDSFRLLSDPDFTKVAELSPNAEARLMQITELSLAAGSSGMVQGQTRDIFWTNRPDHSEDTLKQIHREKTGALMGASLSMGALAGGASGKEALSCRNAGRLYGLAFQAIDDLLDNTSGTGKSKGKDIAANKLTYAKLYDNPQITKIALELTKEAFSILPHRCNRDKIHQFAVHLIDRSH